MAAVAAPAAPAPPASPAQPCCPTQQAPCSCTAAAVQPATDHQPAAGHDCAGQPPQVLEAAARPAPPTQQLLLLLVTATALQVQHQAWHSAAAAADLSRVPGAGQCQRRLQEPQHRNWPSSQTWSMIATGGRPSAAIEAAGRRGAGGEPPAACVQLQACHRR